MTGFSPAHATEAIGCASCHLGNSLTLDPRRAHAGMVLVPGNLADAARTCGQSACHAEIVPRVERSIMATFAGVIATSRKVFGGSGVADEHVAQGAAAPPHVRDLGQEKTFWEPISQESRGGGCNACHLKHSPEAARDLAAYMPEVPDWNADGSPPRPPAPSGKPFPRVHPALSVQADGSHCFGCHSRSSRIATSYEGWHELRDDPSAAELAATPERFRQLDDTRYFVRRSADVHHTAGLDCIDCHVPPGGRLASREPAAADPESRKILALRGWTFRPGERVGTTRSGDTLLNIVVDAAGRGQLRRKASGQPAPLQPQAAACAEGAGHERLSCASCHTPWTPQCTTCHTAFDPASEGHDHLAAKFVRGEWMESSTAFDAGPPTLGVRVATGLGERGGETVDTFVPGMILTIDRKLQADQAPDIVFRRLFAPSAAHTTQRQARSCQSCHNDPLALGYGRGELRYELARSAAGGRSGRWRFVPARPASPHDGLPEDAWTGFVAERTGMVSTQAGARPFTVPEQQRILTVGACLTCHEGESAVMRASVRDFPALVRRRSASCALPAWDRR